jgi:hypothetical protein
LITVIGEISNKSESSRKFVQTFVLAEQPNGYYVLNDIFRYLVDEEDEVMNDAPAPVEQPAVEVPAQAAPEPEPTAAETHAVDDETAASKVDEKLEQAEANGQVVPSQEPTPQTNGADIQEEPQAAAAPAEPTETPTKTEKPLSPQPTPASPTQQAPAAPEQESPAQARSGPKTWANIASKTGAAAPVVPAVPVAPPKPASAANAAQQAPAAAPAPRETTSSQPSSNDGSGWQTAGHEHKKTQSRAGEDQVVLAYIKNVNDKVDASLLRQTLSRFGKLKYFDVSRPKVCKSWQPVD